MMGKGCQMHYFFMYVQFWRAILSENFLGLRTFLLKIRTVKFAFFDNFGAHLLKIYNSCIRKNYIHGSRRYPLQICNKWIFPGT